jgi:hypothetical protein
MDRYGFMTGLWQQGLTAPVPDITVPVMISASAVRSWPGVTS